MWIAGEPATCDRKWLIFRPRLDVKVGYDQLPLAPKFIHLKVHSAYSLLEGALPIGKIAKLADAYGMPAIGLSDTNNLFGILEFSEKLSGAGIQPIAGMTLDIDFRDSTAPAHGCSASGQNDAPVRPAGPIALYAAERGRLRPSHQACWSQRVPCDRAYLPDACWYRQARRASAAD